MPTVEKSILVPLKVDDLYGLYMDLRKSEFRIRNVGSDARGTYVYLDPEEEKDPVPVVENWVGKAAPKISPLVRDMRIRELKKLEEEEQKRLEERQKAERDAENPNLEEVVEVESKATEKMGFLKRIFRKFF